VDVAINFVKTWEDWMIAQPYSEDGTMQTKFLNLYQKVRRCFQSDPADIEGFWERNIINNGLDPVERTSDEKTPLGKMIQWWIGCGGFSSPDNFPDIFKLHLANDIVALKTVVLDRKNFWKTINNQDLQGVRDLTIGEDLSPIQMIFVAGMLGGTEGFHRAVEDQLQKTGDVRAFLMALNYALKYLVKAPDVSSNSSGAAR
jgi:hypothetical protein